MIIRQDIVLTLYDVRSDELANHQHISLNFPHGRNEGFFLDLFFFQYTEE